MKEGMILHHWKLADWARLHQAFFFEKLFLIVLGRRISDQQCQVTHDQVLFLFLFC